MNTTTKSQSFPNILNDLVNFSFDKVFNEDYYNVNNGFKAPTNIVEHENAYQLELAVPGREKADFTLSVDKNILTIETVKKQVTTEENKPEKFVKKEFKIDAFKRSFNIGNKVDTSKIEANYVNGILSITLPKREEAKYLPTQIVVN
jgi:HSP20 family protein